MEKLAPEDVRISNLSDLRRLCSRRRPVTDHTRAFRLHKKLAHPKRLVKCERRLLGALRDLDYGEVERELKLCLRKSEIEALMARRDEIVRLFDRKIASSGESRVLYDFLR